MNDTNSIKEMMRNGATADDLIKILQRDIAKATKELEAEKEKAAADEKEKRIAVWRNEVIKVLTGYLKELGMLDSTDFTPEAKSVLVDNLKVFEKQMAQTKSFADQLEKMFADRASSKTKFADKKNNLNFSDDSSKIIRDFIHNIM